ncbi:MAG TPA: hypothetical protein VGO62_00040 [Myxococcota bacterium]
MLLLALFPSALACAPASDESAWMPDIAALDAAHKSSALAAIPMQPFCGLNVPHTFYVATYGSMGWSTLSMEPEQNGFLGTPYWTLPKTPAPDRTYLYLQFHLADPSNPCAPLAADVARDGALTIDEQAPGAGTIFHAVDTYELSALVQVPQGSGQHVVTIIYGSVQQALYLTFTPINPFVFLQRSYNSERCQTCHAIGAGSESPSHINHPFSPIPHDNSTGCENCHDEYYAHYSPTPAHAWETPGPQRGMDWSQMTPHEQCTTTVNHLPTVNEQRDHFNNDTRLRWAVEDGITHSSPFTQMPVAWPYNYTDFLDTAHMWINQGAPCDHLSPSDLSRFNMQ